MLLNPASKKPTLVVGLFLVYFIFVVANYILSVAQFGRVAWFFQFD